MTPNTPEQQLSNAVLEALIKGGLLLLLVYVCYLIFSPFLALMLWALVLTITLHPSHQQLSRRLGQRPGLAASLMVLLGILLLLIPGALLVGSMAEPLKHLPSDSWQVPASSAQVAAWPLVGRSCMPSGNKRPRICPACCSRRPPNWARSSRRC